MRFLKPSIHLDDDCLTSYLCDELNGIATFFVRRHLAACWRCRGRLERLERAALAAVEYHDALKMPGAHLPPGGREKFIHGLDELIANTSPKFGWSIRREPLSRRELPSWNVAIATVSLLCMGVVSFATWQAWRTPHITSNALLVRAEAWDTPATMHSHGVVQQKVSIATSQHTFEHAIYRDVEGKRHPKAAAPSSVEQQLQAHLAVANVSWDAPLSATSYQDWHDHQRVREEQITRSGKHLLRLTTSTPNGEIATQSLTVRDTDFRPVERTVAFRNNETIEIAEVSYAVLPWNPELASAFEPADPVSPTIGSVVPSITAALVLPHIVTPGQLDEAELGVRLVLNRLHADTGEQISIEHASQQIEIKGIVDTERRKQELMTQLHLIPHVVPSILSLQDMKNSSGGEGITRITAASATTTASPLENYLAAHPRSDINLAITSQQLLTDATIVSRESKALSELAVRLADGDGRPRLSDLASATATELAFSHWERLLEALKEERRILSQVSGADHSAESSPVVQIDAATFAASAEGNLSFCKELTGGNSAPSRAADAILADLSALLDRLNAAAPQLQIKPANAADGRK
jgi:hypothetical protein